VLLLVRTTLARFENYLADPMASGQDMAAAFLEYILGKEAAKPMLAGIELSPRGEGDDEFAGYHGLV
jgi:hypothetical protein